MSVVIKLGILLSEPKEMFHHICGLQKCALQKLILKYWLDWTHRLKLTFKNSRKAGLDMHAFLMRAMALVKLFT